MLHVFIVLTHDGESLDSVTKVAYFHQPKITISLWGHQCLGAFWLGTIFLFCTHKLQQYIHEGRAVVLFGISGEKL